MTVCTSSKARFVARRAILSATLIPLMWLGSPSYRLDIDASRQAAGPHSRNSAVSISTAPGDAAAADEPGSEVLLFLPFTVKERHLAAEAIGQTGGRVSDVVYRDGLAFMAVGPRLLLVDVTDSDQPTIVGRTPILPDLVEDIELYGPYVILANGHGGVRFDEGHRCV